MAGTVGLGLPGGNVDSQVMVGAVGLGLMGGHVGSRAMSRAVDPGLPGGHVVHSQSMAGAVGPGLPGGLVGSQVMAGAVGVGLPGGHVGSLFMENVVGLGLPAAMLVSGAWQVLWIWGCQADISLPGAWRELWDQGSRRPCWFPRHGKSCGPRASAGNVLSQGTAGAVGPGLPLAMLVPMARRELWVWGCRRPCWFSGHGGSCGTEAAAGHVGSRGMEGAVVPGLPPAMLVLGAWPELWSWGCFRPCWFPEHGWSCGPGADPSHVGSQGMAGAVGLGLPLAILVVGAWRELWAQGCYAAMLVFGA